MKSASERFPQAASLLLPWLLLLGGAAPPALSIQDFGAINDGQTLNTQAIQRAIDAASRQAGAVVRIPAGRFLTGTLVLKDGVTLDLDAEATLLGSTDPKDYRLLDPFTDGTGQSRGYALIVAVDAKNVGITGSGIIDGQGRQLLQRGRESREDHRPFLVRWVRCRDVTVSGVRMRSAAAWNMHFFQCRNVSVSKLNIHNQTGANNDGINIDSSQDVTVKDCVIDSGDDSICLKTTSIEPCRNITISGCTMTTRCAAFKMGTESLGDFENISVSNCHIIEARLGGIKILSVDGARLQNVAVSDITMDGGSVAVFLRLGARFRTFRPDDPKRETGVLQGITVRNITAKVEAPGIMISGIPGHDVENVTFDRIDLQLPGKGTLQQAAARPEEKPDAYPEIRMFGSALPAYAVYARHVKGLSLGRISVRTTEPDLRPAIHFDDVKQVNVTGWTLPRLPADAAPPLRVEGKQSSNIRLHNMPGTESPGFFSLGDDVAPSAIQTSVPTPDRIIPKEP